MRREQAEQLAAAIEKLIQTMAHVMIGAATHTLRGKSGQADVEWALEELVRCLEEIKQPKL